MTQHIWRSMKYNPLWSKKRKEKIMTVFVLVIAIVCTSVMLVASWLPWWWSYHGSVDGVRLGGACHGLVLVIIILCSPGAGLRCGLLGFLIMPEGEGCRGREPGPLSTSSYTLCCKIYKTARKNNAFKKNGAASTGGWASLNVILHSLLLLQNIQNSEKKTMLSKTLVWLAEFVNN